MIGFNAWTLPNVQLLIRGVNKAIALAIARAQARAIEKRVSASMKQTERARLSAMQGALLRDHAFAIVVFAEHCFN